MYPAITYITASASRTDTCPALEAGAECERIRLRASSGGPPENRRSRMASEMPHGSDGADGRVGIGGDSFRAPGMGNGTADEAGDGG